MLVVGDVDVAVPQNLAVAANYECTSCLTYALAVQLFLTVPATLSEDAITSINELWEQIAAYGATITQVPLDEIQDQLTAYEQQVLDIIEADVGPLDGTETPSPTDAPTTESETSTESSTPSPSETTSETPTPTPSETTTTTLSPTPSPTPSESPSESPSSSPSPTPTESPTPTTPAPTSTSPTESASPAATPTSGSS